MSYGLWFDAHAKKHKSIIDKLLACGSSKEQIIEYFVFENMVKNEPDFCPLFAQNKKCHAMQELNCYLCACPNFRFDDEGIKKVDDKTQYSYCSIDSKEGSLGVYGQAIHQDCSACTVPHAGDYVRKHFDLDWKKIMKNCR
ncbi:hypothetical protein KJ877_01135 [bacterium]|nr:hypothetical protein [bacterium]MBU1989866.1 hypothetical protein [bacterium]